MEFFDLQRTIAVFLAAVLGTQSVFGWHTNIGPEPMGALSPPAVSLSLQQFVRSKSGVENLFAQDRTIYLFEDIHLNEEAQRHIAGALQVLGEKKGNAGQSFVVGIEGSVGPFDFTPYHRLSDQAAVKTIADRYLHQGLIGAAVYAALTSRNRRSEPVIVGLEDDVIYRQNIESYRSAKRNAERLADGIGKEDVLLDEKAEKIFSPREYVWLQMKKSYESGERTLPEYLHFLAEQFPGLQLPPALSAFHKAAEIEKSIRLEPIEKVRARIEQGRMPGLASAELAALKKSAPSDILDGLQDVESRLTKQLAFTAEQANVVNKLRALALAKKLKDFSLTADEWTELRAHGFSSASLAPFERFYFCAEARNDILARNFISALQEQRTSSGALIVGGFHAQSIKRVLEENGFHVVDLTPVMTKVDLQSGNRYLNGIHGAARSDRLSLSPRCAAIKIKFARAVFTGLFGSDAVAGFF